MNRIDSANRAIIKASDTTPVSAVPHTEKPMDKQAFFLIIEPTQAELEAARPTPDRRARACVNNPRQTTLFLARAERLWLEASNPAQAARNDFAKVLEAKAGKYWSSDDASQRRVYFNFVPLSERSAVAAYYDINTGVWHHTAGDVLRTDTVAALLAKLEI